jgi:tetratricopeptide (TPR) repeat protein
MNFGDWAQASSQAHERYQDDGDVDSLNEAIFLLRVTADHANRVNVPVPGIISNLSVCLHDRYNMLESEPDIDEAILRGNQAIARRSPQHPDRPRLLNNLGQFHGSRFETHVGESDLNQAIYHTQLAVAEALEHGDDAAPSFLNHLIDFFFLQKEHFESDQNYENATNVIESFLLGEGDRTNASAHSRLATLYFWKYEHTLDMANMYKAISHSEAAVMATPEHDGNGSARLVNLSNYQLTVFENDGDGDILSRALLNARKAVALNDCNPEDQLINVLTLANVLHHSYRHLGNIDNLDEAIGLSKEVLDATPNQNSIWLGRVLNLSIYRYDKYKAVGDVDDLDSALDALEEGITIDDQDLFTHLRCTAHLSDMLKARHEKTLAIGDLDRATKICLESIETMSAVPLESLRIRKFEADAFADLSSISRRRFNSMGVDSDIESAIKYAQLGIDLMKDDPGKYKCAKSLALALWVHFKANGNMSELNEALSWMIESIESHSIGESERVTDLANLSMISQTRFEATGDEEDLTRCIDSAVAALALANSQEPILRAALLETASSAYTSKCERFGSLDDIHLAIKYAIDASNLATATPNMPIDRLGSICCTLSISLQLRYQRLRALTDLQEAIDSIERVVGILHGHSEHSTLLNNLGDLLRLRFARTHDPKSLGRAIEVLAQAIDNSPENDPSKGMCLQNMCLALMDTFKLTQEQGSLDEAIRCIEISLQHTTKHDIQRAVRLSSSASCYGARYDHLHDPVDLEQAIARTQDAINSAPSDSPECYMYYSNLGRYQTQRYVAVGSKEDIESARRSYELVLGNSSAPPLYRVIAGYSAASNAVAGKELKAAQKLLETAIDISPKISPRSIARGDQEHVLAGLSGISSYAASVALEANDTPAHALQLQEAGRGVIAGLTIAGRSDIALLEAIAPELSAEYKACRDELSILPSRTLLSFNRLDNNFSAAQISRRHELSKKLEELEVKVRKDVPGCADFQSAPTPELFKNLARKGPIVSFNVSELRSDAILVTESEIRHVPLPDLQHETLVKYAKLLSMKPRLTARNLRTKFERNKTMLEILKWLWDVAVYPALQGLGIRQSSSSEELPRVWWTASGLMGLMPIHAAGDHTSSTSPCMFNFAIPTYTTFLRALAYAREVPWKPLRGASSYFVLIATPNLPGRDELTVDAEVTEISRQVGKLSKSKILTNPSKEEVLSQLQMCNVVHFGCHGNSDPESPSKSYLELGLDPDSWLMVEELQGPRHKQAQIAYLSACSTATVSALTLVDEVIHVAGAFQLLGFGQVLGTLWIAKDKAASVMAKTFYETLMAAGQSGDEDAAALAYHSAVMKVRQKNLADPLVWATFVHFGA